MVESVALTVGKIVGIRAGGLWLAGRRDKGDRDKDLVELIQLRFPDRIHRRRAERQLDEIADSVAERVITLCGHEFGGLGENDKAAVLVDVADVLKAADLSDEALFAADAVPALLARRVLEADGRDRHGQLGEAGARLFEVVLEECCECLVQIVRQLPQFGPRASAEILTRLTGLADEVAGMLARLPARTLDAPQGTADDEEFGRRYLRHVSETLDTIELFGVRIERYRPRTTLSVAYINLSVSTETEERKEAFAAWRSGEREPEQSTVRVETALGRNRLLLIRGEAGAGKSTLLRWLAVSAVRGAYTGDLAEWNGCTPFLIKLRSHAGRPLPAPERFLDGVADPIAGLMPPGWVHRRLATGRAVLLIDGIDELPAGQRQSVRTWLRGLLSAYPEIRVVVTSRPAAASGRWLADEGFATAFLERMGPADIKALISHWHEAMRDHPDLPCAAEKLPGYEAALLSRLEAAPHLRVLAGSPLLAAMLCALNLDRATQLPRDRMGIYAAALELLLERRDAERDIPSSLEVPLEREQKIQILQDLAWRTSTTGRTELPKNVALRRVEERLKSMPRVTAPAEQVLEHLLQRSGVLREPVPGRIDFVHRTVQEYLTAKQAAEDGDLEPLIENAHRDQWRETVVMAAGHANAPLRRELIAGLLHRAAAEPRRARTLKLLLAACLETLPTIPPELAAEVDACVDSLIPPRDLASARSLASAGETVLARLPRSLEGLSVAAARATVRTAWLVNGPAALALLEGYASDSRPEVQEELIEGWAYSDPEEYARRVLSDAPLVHGRVTPPSRAVLPYLRLLNRIERLKLRYVETPDTDFLSGVRPLTHLDILGRRGSVSPSGLFGHANSLKELYLYTEEIVGGYDFLYGLPRLEKLSITGQQFAAINFIEGLPKLIHLVLSSLDMVTDYRPLVGQTALVSLSLFDCKNLFSLDVLPPLDRLEALYLPSSRLESDAESIMSAAPNLKSLNLIGADWGGGLAGFAGTGLLKLHIGDNPNIRDIAPLAMCERLEELSVNNTQVEELPRFTSPRLRSLDLRDCERITDLSPLADVRGIRELYIGGIADGVDLAPLAANDRLTVYISHDQIIENGEALGRRLRVYGTS
ncbi:NACHT N-terminal Helical domain 1-containing protein [Actinomadura macrotermitis]|uniref:NACHT domain-containing protein n=1 Tax=Actinomadura macrotermitis TaxID=2585200 RepID=A0A7K0C4U9_9ACTN|nr:hypothetical protein [Actinomadura macrotermitis]